MQRKSKEQIMFREKSRYWDIFQKKPTRFRIYETLFYGLILFLLAQVIPSDTTEYKMCAVLAAVLIIGGAPVFYRWLLQPEYTLMKMELLISIRGQVRHFPLSEVERTSEWKALFRLSGKKETLMVSKVFLNHLDDQLEKLQSKKKR